MSEDFYDAKWESPEEVAQRLNVPLIKPNFNPPSVDPNGPVAVCGQCGLTVYRVMAYCCQHQNCPCGLGSSGSLCLNNIVPSMHGKL